MNKSKLSLLFSMNFLKKQRQYTSLVNEQILLSPCLHENKLKTATRFFVLIKTSNHFFQKSDMVPCIENKILFYKE